MNSSMEYTPEESYEEEATNDRRMTRVISKSEVQLSDQSCDFESESDSFHSEGSVQTPPHLKTENADNVIDRITGMTQGQVHELLNKLNLSEDEENPTEKTNTEEECDIEEKQHKNKQKGQVKTVIKEGKKNKEELEAKTSSKESKKVNKEGTENSSENTANKTKKGVKGKKNNSKNTNTDSQSEESSKKTENESKRKLVESVHSNNTQNESLTIKTKLNEIATEQENNPENSKNQKPAFHNTNKEKQTKPSKKLGNDVNVKELDNNNALQHVESHLEGRVTRSTRSKQENTKNVLKEINEPLKDIVSQPAKGQNKKNNKKLESEIKETEDKPDSTITGDVAVGKKKTGKKVVQEVNKHVETEIENETNKEEKPVKIKKTGKKAPTGIEILKDSQENPSVLSVKEGANIKKPNTHKKDQIQNSVQKELDSIGESTKPKKKTTNSKTSKVVEEHKPHTNSSEQTKKADPVKTKKVLENKENKINDDTAPNKRAARKK